MLGSIIIVLHAPPDKDIKTVDEIMVYAMQPGFLFYMFLAFTYTAYMMYRVAPTHGPRNPLVWISMCSLVGSISIMCIKVSGESSEWTLAHLFAGRWYRIAPDVRRSQPIRFASDIHYGRYRRGVSAHADVLLHQGTPTNRWPSSHLTLAQQVLDTFSTNVVNPIYFVMFSTSTIVASILLFQGFNTTDTSTVASLLAGFVTTFIGVHLLNYERAAAENVTRRSQTNVASHHSRHGRHSGSNGDQIPLRLDTDADEYGQDVEVRGLNYRSWMPTDEHRQIGPHSGTMNGAFMRSAGVDTPTSASWRTGAHVTHLPVGRNGRTGNGGSAAPHNLHGDGELYRAQSSALVNAFEIDDSAAANGSANGSGDEARIAKRRWSLEPAER